MGTDSTSSQASSSGDPSQGVPGDTFPRCPPGRTVTTSTTALSGTAAKSVRCNTMASLAHAHLTHTANSLTHSHITIITHTLTHSLGCAPLTGNCMICHEDDAEHDLFVCEGERDYTRRHTHARMCTPTHSISFTLVQVASTCPIKTARQDTTVAESSEKKKTSSATTATTKCR